MIELTDFAPLKTTQSSTAPTRAALDSLDHCLLVVAKKPTAKNLARFPHGRELGALLARAAKQGEESAETRAQNSRATGLTIASFSSPTAFGALTWAAKTLRGCLRDKPASLGIAFIGLDAEAERSAAASLVAAAHATAFALPTFKTKKESGNRLRSVKLFGSNGPDLAAARAEAFGNNLARWLTALPPNVLTAAAYRDAIERLVKPLGIEYRFLDEKKLDELGAGAFLAVAKGNATRDAGIVHLRYRPKRGARAELALVGKGVIFDTGGTNLKPFAGMLDMHIDMQGSAVALGTLLALAGLEVPYGIDAWLAVTENRTDATAYKPQDLVRAINGTTIQVIHTDAEGRMILADTLALAAREEPQLIVDYATLTGACVTAVTERYSGVFTNRVSAHAMLLAAGAASGERVWPFPMDDDFDELIKSDVADVKQCALESAGDHIAAARFLNRFVPSGVPWVHVDLSAGQHKGGLAHVPTDITGFGVRFTLELLRQQSEGPVDFVRRLKS